MNVLLGFLVFVGCVYLFFSLFGRLILKYGMKFLIKRAGKSMEAQTRNFHQHAENSSPFEDKVYVDRDTKVSIPKNKKDPKQNSTEGSVVEEVEFEDIWSLWG